SPAGSGSETTAPVAVPGPLLVTVTRNVKGASVVGVGSSTVFVRDRSASGIATEVNCASLLLGSSATMVPATLLVVVMSVALDAIRPVIVIADAAWPAARPGPAVAESPAAAGATVAVCTHVTVWPATVQAHPSPVAPVGVASGGKSMVVVIGPGS